MQIKSRWNGEVLYECEADSLIEVVIKAVEAEANLAGANLARADLTRADLTRADLAGANLTRADLTRANLTEADLAGANLAEANLTRADLARANLAGADLTRAYLARADLTRANLAGADLTGAELPHFQICPEVGSFIGFKKLDNGIIATLLIPDGARRMTPLGYRKCRAERVRVLSGNGKSPTANTKLEYREGDMVEADSFDDDIRVEYSHGIAFFVTRKEAEEWI